MATPFRECDVGACDCKTQGIRCFDSPVLTWLNLFLGILLMGNLWCSNRWSFLALPANCVHHQEFNMPMLLCAMFYKHPICKFPTTVSHHDNISCKHECQQSCNKKKSQLNEKTEVSYPQEEVHHEEDVKSQIHLGGDFAGPIHALLNWPTTKGSWYLYSKENKLTRCVTGKYVYPGYTRDPQSQDKFQASIFNSTYYKPWHWFDYSIRVNYMMAGIYVVW